MKHLASFLAQCLHLLSGMVAFLFMPSQLHLDSLEQWNELDKEELDEISLQLDQLWTGLGRQLLSRKVYPCRAENTGLMTSLQVDAELRSLRLSLLSYASINAASSQMLACYRHAGEPAAMGSSVYSLPRHSAFSFNNTYPSKFKKHSLHYCGCAFFVPCHPHHLNNITKARNALLVSLASLQPLFIYKWILFSCKNTYPPDFELSSKICFA